MIRPARLLALWAAASAALWLHALLGIPGDYLGQGYPLLPGLKVSLASLARDVGLETLPLLPAGLVAQWLGLRWLALPVLALLWLMSAAMLIDPFTIDFGTTWTGIDALVELFVHPVLTPLALAALLAVATWSLAPRG
jgi:hypothetical protein